MKRLIACVCLGACLSDISAQRVRKPMPVIFDSDMGPDYDDVGAITLLHAYADSGLVKILATVASTSYPGVAGIFSVFNTYFQRPDIPIGVPKGPSLTLRDWQHWTDTLLQRYPHRVRSNEEAPDAVTVYRAALSAQADRSVTIITVGFLTNLSNLLQSRPDQYSSLDGTALVRQKVRQLVCMAGKFPSGFEFNVMKDAPASRYVYSHWPGPILFSGFEIGEKIHVGLPLIHATDIHHSPVQDVFRISIPLDPQDSAGRMSWDETAVLVAVQGYAPYYRLDQGHIAVAADGSDIWTSQGDDTQARLVAAMPPAAVQAVINRLIMHQPSGTGKGSPGPP